MKGVMITVIGVSISEPLSLRLLTLLWQRQGIKEVEGHEVQRSVHNY